MLIALVSAKGAPGVTVTTVALAALWPRPVVVADLDPAGGDLAVRYRTASGSPVDPGTGLLSLAADARAGGDVRLEEHVQTLAGGLPLLVGVTSPDQVLGLGPIWPHVARLLAAGDVDVIADCGRVGGTTPVQPVLSAADVVLMVTRSDAAALAHTRERLSSLMRSWRTADRNPDLAVVVVAPERERSAPTQVARLLATSGVDVPVLGQVVLDRPGAAALERADSRRAGRSLLVRSVRGLLPRVAHAGPRPDERPPAPFPATAVAP